MIINHRNDIVSGQYLRELKLSSDALLGHLVCLLRRQWKHLLARIKCAS